jgi:hypothetical protein
MAFCDRVGDPAVPLLDKGTLNGESAGQRARFSSFGNAYQVVVFPTAGEASIRFTGRQNVEPWKEPLDSDNENLSRSVRRSKSALRRFCVHNGLGYMCTLTFRNDPSTELAVTRAVDLFLRRLRFSGIHGSYAWVIERGKKGRLHVHFACSWWAGVGAVEVCDHCATAGLRQVRFDLPPRGSICVGCLWGQGFVGAPSEAIGDPRGVALYVSKYAAQDFGLREGGVNRYHVPRGYQPPVLRHGAVTFEQAKNLIGRSYDVAAAEVTAMHELFREEWHGPLLWSYRWGLSQQ